MYIRVSTDGQNTAGQQAELSQYAKNRDWEVTKIYCDKISGTTTTRPGLAELMADAKKRKFTTVLVWRFDRFARSVSHLLQALETFRTLDIDFVSLSEQVDTSTPTGKMVFTVLGSSGGIRAFIDCRTGSDGIAECPKARKAVREAAHPSLEPDRVGKSQGRQSHGKIQS